MNERFLFIDPHYRSKHAVCVVINQTIVQVCEVDDMELYHKILPKDLVYLEDTYFSKNVDTLKKLNRTAGRIEFMCMLKEVDIHYINPALWQRYHGCYGLKPKEKKERYLSLAHDIYKYNMTVDEACAVLMADYTMQIT